MKDGRGKVLPGFPLSPEMTHRDKTKRGPSGDAEQEGAFFVLVGSSALDRKRDATVPRDVLAAAH